MENLYVVIIMPLIFLLGIFIYYHWSRGGLKFGVKKAEGDTLVFGRCPICHCTETVSEHYLNPLKKEGKVEKDVPVSAAKTPIPLLPPEQAMVSVAVMVIHEDFCANCGLPRCVRSEKKDLPLNTMQGPPPGARPNKRF